MKIYISFISIYFVLFGNKLNHLSILMGGLEKYESNRGNENVWKRKYYNLLFKKIFSSQGHLLHSKCLKDEDNKLQHQLSNI